jgi:exodeoxyribonuclease V beta subunit
VGRPGSTLEAAVFGGSIPDDWRLLSFSALAQGRDGERPDHDALAATLTSAPEPDPDLGRVEAADVAPGPGAGPEARRLDRPAPVPAIDPVFRFPRGVRAGHCLHDLFEHLDFRAAAGPGLHGAVASALARHGIEPQWTETLVELVTRVLDAPLGPPGLRLRGVGPEDRRNELEFHFALDRFDPAGLTQLLAEHGVPGGVPVLASAGAAARALSGLMKGFVDLVLRAEGRFYVVDYKSNHLGDSLDDYGPEGMGRAMVQHGYHLQYLIYTLALHRYLKRRLPGYDYDRHQGGALYLFLRGMTPAGGPGQGIFAARPSRRLIEDLDRLFGASVTGGSSYEPS